MSEEWAGVSAFSSIRCRFLWSHTDGKKIYDLEKEVQFPCFIPAGAEIETAGCFGGIKVSSYMTIDIDNGIQTVHLPEWKMPPEGDVSLLEFVQSLEEYGWRIDSEDSYSP